MVCFNEGASEPVKAAAVDKSIPTPGLIIEAASKARLMAMQVVIKYSPMVLPAIKPIREFFPKEAVPNTRETKTRGTTSNRSDRTNIWPTVSKRPITRPCSIKLRKAAGRLSRPNRILKTPPSTSPASIAISILWVRLIGIYRLLFYFQLIKTNLVWLRCNLLVCFGRALYLLKTVNDNSFLVR